MHGAKVKPISILASGKSILAVVVFIVILLFSLPAESYAGIGSWTSTGPDGSTIYSVTMGGSNPNATVFAGASNGGVCVSDDYGRSWDDCSGTLAGYTVYSVVASPNYENDKTAFAATKGGGIFKTENGGTTWTRLSSVPTGVNIFCLAISPDYSADGTLYAGASYSKSVGNIFKLTGGGNTCTKYLAGNMSVASIAISPNYKNDGTVLAGTNGNGIYRTQNKGGSWGRVLEDIDSTVFVRSVAFSPEYSSDSTIFAGTGDLIGMGGIYRSTDKGNNWDQTGTGLAYITAVAVAPNSTTSNTVIAGSTEGIYISEDGGLNWDGLNDGLENTFALGLTISKSYASDGIVFAGTSGDGVYIISSKEPPSGGGGDSGGGDSGGGSGGGSGDETTTPGGGDSTTTPGGGGSGGSGGGDSTSTPGGGDSTTTPGGGDSTSTPDGNGGNNSGGGSNNESGGGSGGGGGGGGGGGDVNVVDDGSIKAPTNVQLVKGVSSITLSWDAVRGASKYKVYRKTNDSEWASLYEMVSTTYTDPSAKPSILYYYSVASIDSHGKESAKSGTKTAILDLTFSPPSSLMATVLQNSVSLSWIPSSKAVGYSIYRADGSSNPSKVGTSSEAKYVDMTVKAGIVYTYYVVALDSSGNESSQSNTVTASLVVVKAAIAFSDIPANAWYREYVSRLVSLKITSGYPNGTFGPNKTVTRAEFAKMICLSMGWTISAPAKASFGDVSKKHWAYGYIETAKAHGAISGYAGALFMPQKNITRAEIAKIIAAILKLSGGSSQFKDTNGHWARASIDACVAAKIIGGYPTNEFRPSNSASRAEAAKMIVGVLDHK